MWLQCNGRHARWRPQPVRQRRHRTVADHHLRDVSRETSRAFHALDWCLRLAASRKNTGEGHACHPGGPGRPLSSLQIGKMPRDWAVRGAQLRSAFTLSWHVTACNRNISSYYETGSCLTADVCMARAGIWSPARNAFPIFFAWHARAGGRPQYKQAGTVHGPSRQERGESVSFGGHMGRIGDSGTVRTIPGKPADSGSGCGSKTKKICVGFFLCLPASCDIIGALQQSNIPGFFR